MGIEKKVEEWQEVCFKRALIRMLLKHGFTAKEALIKYRDDIM